MARPFFRSQPQITPKTVAYVFATTLALWLVWKFVLAARLTVVWVIVAMVIATALDLGVDWLARHRVPRWAGITLAMLGVPALCTGFGFLFIPTLVEQGREFAGRLPQLIAQVRHSALAQRLGASMDLDALVQRATSHALSAAGDLGAVLSFTVVFVTGVVTIYFVVLFMLLYGSGVLRRLLAEVAPDSRERSRQLLGKVRQAVGGYLAGALAIALINTVLTGTFLAVVGVPFFAPLAVLSGVGSLVPLVGTVTAGAAIALVALISKGWVYGALTVGFYVVYQQLENHLLGPYIRGRTVQVNPLVMIVGSIMFAEAFGVLGAVGSVPAIAIVQIALYEAMSERRARLGLSPRIHLPDTAASEKDGPD